MDDPIADAIREFVVLIAHGDGDHKRWLHEAGEAFIEGRPLPVPRGIGMNIAEA